MVVTFYYSESKHCYGDRSALPTYSATRIRQGLLIYPTKEVQWTDLHDDDGAASNGHDGRQVIIKDATHERASLLDQTVPSFSHED